MDIATLIQIKASEIEMYEWTASNSHAVKGRPLPHGGILISIKDDSGGSMT
jgi:hypothetical protein